MTTTENTKITVKRTVNAPKEKVWDLWTQPHHILQWNNASEDWLTRKAENDLRTGGSFSSRMEAKDGSFGFDFGGTYDEVKTHELISYTIDDGRKTRIEFEGNGGSTTVTETFDAESSNSVEMQKEGWQAILDNFKQYVESKKELITLHFDIDMYTKAVDVQRVMLEDSSYRDWTSFFSPGSYYEGSWEKRQ